MDVGIYMRRYLMALAGAALLAACSLVPRAASLPAEPQVAPKMHWHTTGKGLWIYHNVWGDCAFLEHGHGRNSAWGLWRMPLGAVTAAAPEPDAKRGGYSVAFTCTDGSACIQSGALQNTPDRTDAHTIPFETLERAETYLAVAASVDKACKALK